ncbi:MAG: hypothetical protein LKK10_10710 [Prevotella sp.]|jgi:Na+/alanine symporter|nr:hypothetical protein [Prevotella sp.]MCH4242322.1 hypothetical protein [Prevotella sp.]MCI1816523.1 hypothetical protein [Prevotella sp.]MCI2088729.1 hypothetical protein [Prevotella sp.]MCI2179922.1 hypothetical protein [Prevotella sp.]
MPWKNDWDGNGSLYSSVYSLPVLHSASYGAECMNALLTIPSLISLLMLYEIIVHETRKYLWRGRLDKEMETSDGN